MRILIDKNWKKYIFVFFTTSAIFVAGWFFSTFLNRQKLSDLQDTQNKIATDILSSETQFDLLSELSCDNLGKSPLSQEIALLADKLSYGEQNLENPEEILALKKQYSILEIKDFLLNKRIAEKCNKKFNSILYFYGTDEYCGDCIKQGNTLDILRAKEKDLNVYVFDYSLDLSTIKALKDIYSIKNTLPAVVVNGVTFYGYQNIENLSKALGIRP